MSKARNASTNRLRSSSSAPSGALGPAVRVGVLDRRPRPLDGVVHRVEGHAEQVGGLSCRVAEDVAKDQDRALPWGQLLQGDDERERDRLPGLVPCLRSRRLVGEPVEEDVGKGLQPRQLAVAGWGRR
jgi:hypothetical protein